MSGRNMYRREVPRLDIPGVDASVAKDLNSGRTALPEATDTPDFGLSPAWERSCRELWRQGIQIVKKPDGSVEDWDVVHWLLTRKGGEKFVWSEQEECDQAIGEMSRETLDLNRIRTEIIDEHEERLRKEEKRRWNKWRNRPRSAWEEEEGASKTGSCYANKWP